MACLRKILWILVLLPTLLLGQRENENLPLFEGIPYFSLTDSIDGWSLSADGQWLSAPKTIPPIGISRNTEFYEQKNNLLGIDNIQSLIAYKVLYGQDTMICLVKLWTEGYFKYPNRKAGWREQSDMYYWLVRYEDLKAALNYYQAKDTGQAFVLKIRSYDSKLIEDIDEDEILDNVKANLLVKKNFDRNLVLTIRRGHSSDLIQFHLLSLHMVFTDIEGVRQNLKVKGRTVYGSTRLFDYLYYETDLLNFFEILNLKANQRILEEEGIGFEEAPVFGGSSDYDEEDDFSDSDSTMVDDDDWLEDEG